MQTKRNNIQDREEREEVAESAHELSGRESAERHQREDFALRHLLACGSHSCQSSAKVTRRVFCGMLSAPLMWAARGTTIGAQLEAVRPELKRDPDATLKGLADIGFKDVEGYNRVETIALIPKLKRYGLSARSCQVEVPLITQNWDPYPEFRPVSLIEAIDGVAGAGIQYFTMSPIGNGARGDGDDFYRRTADRMNAAGEFCRKAKIRFAWQAHALDFEGRAGMRAIDIYRERLDLKLVAMELDVLQAVIARQNATRILKEWKDHVALLRVTSASVGTMAPGVEYSFIGLDDGTGGPLAALRMAYSSIGSR